ncbi:MAG: hypothetical protein RMM53_00765 [Bacteroidia bacterium]|nr:hypothetical protein [Bacteroidia bacterium]MDW8332727.1 hypothetical protein [Bacteroidia bacterium]
MFILPISNGKYAIVRGEGYVDIPPIQTAVQTHASALDFEPETSQVGDSEMQHLDYAYAASIIRDFMSDQTLILTIRGRKYTPRFEFYAGDYRHRITVHGVQTEVDAGYEGKNQVVLIEAKNAPSSNVIIRQLYYPFRQWMAHTRKPVKIVFFEKKDGEYRLWEFGFSDPEDYHSIQLTRSGKYVVV